MEASVRAGAPALAPEIRGRNSVANIFRGRARAAQLALVDGDSGLVFAPGGQPRVVVDFVLEDGRIVATGGAPSSVGRLADIARRRLRRVLSRLDGSRDLVVAIVSGRTPPLVEHALAGRLDAADEAALAKLRIGLDALTQGGRRSG
jgi:hypothetical protein